MFYPMNREQDFLSFHFPYREKTRCREVVGVAPLFGFSQEWMQACSQTALYIGVLEFIFSNFLIKKNMLFVL